MDKQTIIDFYNLLAEDWQMTLMDAMDGGFNCITAFDIMRNLIKCGALAEVDKGLFSAKGREDKVIYFLHTRDIWFEDSEDYINLKSIAEGLTVVQITMLASGRKNDGAIDTFNASKSDIQGLVDCGLIVRNKKSYVVAVEDFTLRKLFDLVQEKIARFVLYIVDCICDFVLDRKETNERTKKFQAQCQKYDILQDLAVDPYGVSQEQTLGLSKSDKRLLACLSGLLYDTLVKRNIVVLRDKKIFRYPDNEQGTAEITDTVLASTVDRMFKIIADIKSKN